MRRVAPGVVPPEFDDLVTVASRRRHTRVATSGVAAVAVLLFGVVAVDQVRSDADAPLAPVGTSTTPARPRPTASTATMPPSPTHRTPQHVVDDPTALLEQLAVSPDDPAVRVAIWRFCPPPNCDHEQLALTVTGDGFETRHDIPLVRRAYSRPRVVALNSDAFYVTSGGRASIVHADGRTEDVIKEPTSQPVGPGELLLPPLRDTSDAYQAIDPGTKVAHPVSLPAVREVDLLQAPDGTLWGTAVTSLDDLWEVIWSTDSGVSWEHHTLGPTYRAIYSPVPSAVSGTFAVIQGTDGATLFPLNKIIRSTDAGTSWETIEQASDDTAYVNAQLVRADGTLLVSIDGWSDWSRRHPNRHPLGFYESNGSAWADLQPVTPGFPGSNTVGEALAGMVSTTQPDATGATAGEIYVRGDDSRVFVSDDGGHSWSETSAR